MFSRTLLERISKSLRQRGLHCAGKPGRAPCASHAERLINGSSVAQKRSRNAPTLDMVAQP